MSDNTTLETQINRLAGSQRRIIVVVAIDARGVSSVVDAALAKRTLLGPGIPNWWFFADFAGGYGALDQPTRAALHGSVQIKATGAVATNPRWASFAKERWHTLQADTFNPMLPENFQLSQSLFSPEFGAYSNPYMQNVGSYEYDAMAAVGLLACKVAPTGALPAKFGTKLWEAATSSTFEFEGLSGVVRFDENGDRDKRTANIQLFNVLQAADGTFSEPLVASFDGTRAPAWAWEGGSMVASGVLFNGGFTTPPTDTIGNIPLAVVFVCVLVAILAIAAAGIMIWRRRHLQAMHELAQANLEQEKQISVMAAAEANWKVPLTEMEAQVLKESLGPRAMPDTMKRLQISPSEVRLLGPEPIGSGHFADVFIADWSGTPCAVKRLRRSRLTEDGLVCFKKEIALHVTLRHPNIVALLGCAIQPEEGKVQAILELCSRGTLEQVLQDKRLNWSAHKLPIAIGIARAMAYLHAQDPPVIHRDLKPSNVLIDDGYNAKLADFGLSREKDDGMMSNVGTPFFAAPEVLRRVRYDENADVWSFGCILETLVSHTAPYAWFSPHGEVVERVADGELKPYVPPTHFLAQTLKHCVELQAADRPRFDALVETLSSSPMGLDAALQPPGPINLAATLQSLANNGAEEAAPSAPPPAGAVDSARFGAEADAQEIVHEIEELEATIKEEPGFLAAWRASLAPSPPPAVPGDLLRPERSTLTLLCIFKNNALEVAYRKHHYFRCASYVRWSLTSAVVLVPAVIVLLPLPDDARFFADPSFDGFLAAIAVALTAAVAAAAVFTFTPWFRHTTLQPMFFLLVLYCVLLTTTMDIIFRTNVAYGCAHSHTPLLNTSTISADGLCASGLTAQQTNAGRAMSYASRYEYTLIAILFFVPLDAPLVLFLAILQAALNEYVLQRNFEYRLYGSIVSHSIALVVLSIVSTLQSRALRHHFLAAARLAYAADERGEQLQCIRERVEWERELAAKDRPRASVRFVLPNAEAKSATDGNSTASDRTPHNMFRPMALDAHPSDLHPSNCSAGMASSLASLPNAWPRNRVNEYFDEGFYRPACFPVDETCSSRPRTTNTPTKAEQRRIISSMYARARSKTPFPASNSA